VLGASLFAANLSTSFRLRKFGMADAAMYGMSLRIDEVHKGQQPEAAVDTEFEEVCACVCACVLLHRLLGMSLRIDEVQCIRSHLHGI
jgi:hypothetical protein